MDNKNVFIAIALSMSVLLFWAAFFEQPKPVNKNLSQTKKIRKFISSNEVFSTDNGQLTPTLKIRRHVIVNRYKDEINNLYKKSFF